MSLPISVDEYSFHGTAIVVAKHNREPYEREALNRGEESIADRVYRDMISAVYRCVARLEKSGDKVSYESTGGWIVTVGNWFGNEYRASATIMWSICPGAVTSYQEMGEHFESMPRCN